MVEPFDPLRLTTSASLNRTRILDLPGVRLEPDVRGKTGYEIASTHYLAEQVRQNARRLGLNLAQSGPAERELPRLLAAALASPDLQVADAARQISRAWGRNLGCLLLTLQRGDAVNRAARPDWDDTYWRHWEQIRRVRLGGGLTSGTLGTHLVADINTVFDEAGFPAPELAISAYGSALPLVGASRYAPAGSPHALILDFGSSFVKRALALYADSTLTALHRLASLPTHWTTHSLAAHTLVASEVFDLVSETIATTWKELAAHTPTLAARVPVSIAAYIRDGQPTDGQGGGYYRLSQLSDNAERLLTQTVSERLGNAIEIKLLHDGTAAASAYAGLERAAVIPLGTAIGIGYPPPVTGLRPVIDNVTFTPLTPESHWNENVAQIQCRREPHDHHDGMG